MSEQHDLTIEEIALLTSKLTLKERYELAIGAVLDGAVWPGMVATPDHSQLVNAVCRLRLVLAPDELTETYKISKEAVHPGRLQQQRLEARPLVMRDHPRLLEFVINVVRESLMRFAPIASPGADVGVHRGMKGSELDAVLEGLGYRLGEGARVQALHALEAAGEVRCSSANRWNALRRIWPPEDPKEAQAHHRFCMLAMLERVVTQRFAGMPNILWLMGFNETPKGRAAMARRLSEGARAWLESKSLTLAQARSGQEAELVWIQTSLMIAKRPVPRMPLPEWLRREVELTIMPATLVRLGMGDQGKQFFKRALTERAERWVKGERQRRAELKRRKLPPGPLPKGLDIKWDTLHRWQEYASFESGELRGASTRGMVPMAMLRIQTLLQEALPDALTLRQIYDYALQHWPVAFHSQELLRRACDQLVASFQAAENRVLGPHRYQREPNWMKGFKAIKMEFNYPELSPNYIESLIGFIGELLQCLAEPDPEDPPFIDSTRYIIPRDQLGAFKTHMQQLRDEEIVDLKGLYGEPDIGGLSAIGGMVSTIRRLSVDI